MAIVRMKKLTLIGLEEEKSEMLKAVQELGSVEIQDINELSETDIPMLEGKAASEQNHNNDIQEKLFQVKTAIELMEKYSGVKKGMFSTRPVVTLDEFNEVLDRQSELLSSVADCIRLQEMLNAINARRGRIKASIDQMSPWSNLDLPFESIKQTGATNALLCKLRSNKIAYFQDWLQENEILADIDIISDAREHSYCLVVYHLSSENETLDKLRELEFDRINLSGFSGNAKQLMNGYKEDLKAIEDEEKQILESITQLSEGLDQLKILYDGLLIEQQKHEAAQRILNTGRAYILKGWIAERDLEALEKCILDITDAVQIQFEDPSEDDIIPTTLDNPSLVEPFEVVTSLYSTPNQKDVDPNRVMAPFYFAMFGIMMGDAGYGIVMAVAGAILLKKMKLKGSAKKLIGLLALCGISTFVWGFLSGGWFGDMGERIATSIGLDTAVVWFNPMDDPLMMLGFCFAFGLVHVLTGMAVKAYMSIRDGYVWDAIFDQGFWFVLIIGLLLLILPATAQAGKYIAIGGAVGLVLTQGRAKKNIISKFFSGLLSLYNITGIFSDVLSYSRLFALGLSSAIIGMVFNILASMLSGAWYSIIFAVAIFVIGHIFNILINVLSAFVHSSRLQYIEFFGKFFEGGGHAFSPLSIKTKYIDLTN